MNKNIITKKICKANLCIGIASTLGYCKTHYSRFYRNGHLSTRLNHGEGVTKVEKFWRRVALTANPDKCWEWQGLTDRGGYGTLNFQGKHYKAHRLSFILMVSEIPQNKFILHQCDNRLCVNPSHLRIGTLEENTKDMLDRNRQAKGEKAGNVKLNEQQVTLIRKQAKEGKSQTQISLDFGINNGTVSRIVTRQSWAWLV